MFAWKSLTPDQFIRNLLEKRYHLIWQYTSWIKRVSILLSSFHLSHQKRHMWACVGSCPYYFRCYIGRYKCGVEWGFRLSFSSNTLLSGSSVIFILLFQFDVYGKKNACSIKINLLIDIVQDFFSLNSTNESFLCLKQTEETENFFHEFNERKLFRVWNTEKMEKNPQRTFLIVVKHAQIPRPVPHKK